MGIIYIKKSRKASFLALSVIYILAFAVGVTVYRMLPYSSWLNLLLADIAATVFVFVFSIIFNNASVYDPYWSVQPIVILCAFALDEEITLPRAMILIAVILWGIRLTSNWAYTFHGLDFQDWRYTMLKGKTGVLYPIINFVGIHMVPTLVVYLCTLPAVFLIENKTGCNLLCVLGFVLSVVAFSIQGLADIEMHEFQSKKKKGETTEQFLRTGLWKYSRHPNYLGEILMWWGVAVSAVSVMPKYWFLIFGAIANTCLFFFVSIPLADTHQSRKEGFEEYREATNMLLPLRKKQQLIS